ncbi:cryptococcal mannosyltransferase 1-domain-containing protein [Entophlyctis helioformis]|nr:cryptococcal mannosyltransferase 1-domain-containing protein [Entophlyctis helioformis]
MPPATPHSPSRGTRRMASFAKMSVAGLLTALSVLIVWVAVTQLLLPVVELSGSTPRQHASVDHHEAHAATTNPPASWADSLAKSHGSDASALRSGLDSVIRAFQQEAQLLLGGSKLQLATCDRRRLDPSLIKHGSSAPKKTPPGGPQGTADWAYEYWARRYAPLLSDPSAPRDLAGNGTSNGTSNGTTARKRYFIALNFHNSQDVLPSLLSELLRLVDHLGPDRVFVSVFENGSKDRTKSLLRAFEAVLAHFKVPNNINLSDEVSDYKNKNRIDLLAGYRNRAIEPMFKQSVHYNSIFFINDVFHCLDDTLELIHQSEMQQSDITCGFDFWQYSFRFYDTWVGRTLSGNTVREFWYQGSFVYDPAARARYELGLPVQAYSCWNGMAVLNTAPFYKHNVRFRRSDPAAGECAASECQLIAKDYWAAGYGRVLMVPHVRVVYDLYFHPQVRSKKLELMSLALNDLKTDARWVDPKGDAQTRRSQMASARHLTKLGGLPLDTPLMQRLGSLGWVHEADWAAGQISERIDWIYPGPDRVVCYGMEGNGNPDADWAHPVYEKVPYATVPAQRHPPAS